MSRTSSLATVIATAVALVAAPVHAEESPPPAVALPPAAPPAPDVSAGAAPAPAEAAPPAPPVAPPPPAFKPQAGDSEQPVRFRRRTGSGPPPRSKRVMYGGLGLLAGSYLVTALPRQVRASGPLSFGVLPTQNGAFGFAAGRF